MGVPIDYHSYVFGNNHTIIQQSNIPKCKYMKHWNMCAFHHIWKLLPWDFTSNATPVNDNATEFLMKFRGYQEAIPYIYISTILMQRYI